MREWQEKGIEVAMENWDLATIKEYTVDFLSFSYYMSLVVSKDAEQREKVSGNIATGVKNPYLPMTEWGWQIDPVGLRISLLSLYDRYRIPLFIVENGIGAADEIDEKGEINDQYRIDYFKAHFE